jgi:hypothetical protein
MNTLNKVIKVIEKTQLSLIKKVKEKGLYENFGQKEVRLIEDRFIDISDYSSEMNRIRTVISNFDNWCMNYCG